MVQVTNDPFDEDQPILPTAEGQNIPDELKTSTTNVVKEEICKTVAVGSTMISDPIHQTNPTIALKLLESALVNRNMPLAKFYIDNLNELIKQENVLKILQGISKWIHVAGVDRQLSFEPSAPPLIDNNDERNDNWMKEPLNHLRQNILLEIDKNGDFFLKQKEIEDLHYQDILEITTRDSLRVSSELVVYCAIMRWTEQECQRRGLTAEDASVKAVVKDLIYAPRYGLLSKKEFSARTIEGHRGPDRIGMSADINEKILKYIVQKEKKKKDIEKLPYKMSSERISVSPKKTHTGPMKEKVIINCLTCFSAVFD